MISIDDIAIVICYSLKICYFVLILFLFFCVYHNYFYFLFCLIGWVLHLDSPSAVEDIHVFHTRCNTFENMLCNK